MFAKVHQTILDSSLNEEALHVRWAWLTCLTLADRNGNFRVTLPAFARRANLSVEQADDALAVLSSPDPGDSSGNEDGRRLKPLSRNAYSVVNYAYYRELRSSEDRREYQAEWARQKREREREREREAAEDDANVSTAVDAVSTHRPSRPKAEAEADTEADTDTDKYPRQSEALTRSRFDDFWKEWPKKRRKKQARETWLQRLAAGTLPPLPELLAAMKAQVDGKAACDRAGQWAPELPDPDNWLRNERWADDPPKPESRTAANTKGNGTVGTANDSDSVRQQIAAYQAHLQADVDKFRAEWTPEKQAAALRAETLSDEERERRAQAIDEAILAGQPIPRFT